jgi:hypothetical protein
MLVGNNNVYSCDWENIRELVRNLVRSYINKIELPCINAEGGKKWYYLLVPSALIPTLKAVYWEKPDLTKEFIFISSDGYKDTSAYREIGIIHELSFIEATASLDDCLITDEGNYVAVLMTTDLARRLDSLTCSDIDNAEYKVTITTKQTE